ncbi:MAG: radical SAM protein [Deltaproteobacteria bacterium]|nr:radical SAM protein [Deltaproteobacteria bacterium]
MKITLVEIASNRKECINKDFMAGFGWAFNAGESVPARLINMVKKHGERIPLMSFGYLASIFLKAGHQVCFAMDPSRITGQDLVLIQSSMVDYKNEVKAAQILKKTNSAVGFIGTFSTYKPELFLEHADFVITGEPEQWAQTIAATEHVSLKGVLHSEPIMDLDTLPFPCWDIFPWREFSYIPAIRHKPFFPILASRGCLFHCKYCPYPAFYDYRKRGVDAVIEEIQHLQKHHQMQGFLFRDPLFTADQNRTHTFLDTLLKKNIKAVWACETRLDFLNPPLLDRMYQAGCRVINVGIESSSDALLKKTNRKTINTDKQQTIITYADKIGIRITAFYILGLPGETPQSILQTCAYAKKLNTHVAQFFINTPFPGTEEYEEQKNNLIETDWERFDCYTPVLHSATLPPQKLLKLKEYAFVSYYYRWSYLVAFVRRVIRALIKG